MDKIDKYQKIILTILKNYSSIQYTNKSIKNTLLIDEKNHRYMALSMGWNGYKRVHSSPVHFDIINEKIVIQSDHTEYGIVHDLLEQGVPKTDIVLGYYPAEESLELGFAAA